MEGSPRVEFSVRYRLGEYLRFVTEHGFDTQEELRSLHGVRRLLSHVALQIVATVGFVYKSSRVGRCDFIIDASGVSRSTKGGAGSVPWSRVKALHTYSRGFLIELESGAMPVPFRVLSTEQRGHIIQLAAEHLTGRHQLRPTPLRGALDASIGPADERSDN